MIIKLLALIAYASWYSFTSNAAIITFEEYMSQVRKGNNAYIAAEYAKSGAIQAMMESELKFLTQFIASAQYVNNAQLTVAPSVQGTKTVSNQGSIGFAKLSKSLGTQMQLQYNMNNTIISGGSLVPIPVYYQNGLTLTLNQPLWQNFMGRKNRFDALIIQSGTISTAYNQKYNSKTAMMQAEKAFWTLASIREILKIQADNIKNSKAMQNVNRHKRDLELIDDVDLISSNATIGSTRATFDSYHNLEITAAHDFNSARGIESSEVPEEVLLPSVAYITSLKMPEFSEDREDLKAFKAQAEATEAKYKSVADSYSPMLNVSLSASQTGRNAQLSTTVSQSLGQDYPYIIAGLNFTYTLDSSTLKNVQAGYRKQADAAKVNYMQQSVDARNARREIASRFDESRKRLEIVEDLLALQAKQVKSEIDLYSKGRSSSASIFALKQQHATTSIMKAQLMGDIMNMYAELKTYSNEG